MRRCFYSLFSRFILLSYMLYSRCVCVFACCFFFIPSMFLCISLCVDWMYSRCPLESTFVQKVCQCLHSLWCWLPVYTVHSFRVLFTLDGHRRRRAPMNERNRWIDIDSEWENPTRWSLKYYNTSTIRFGISMFYTLESTLFALMPRYTASLLWLGICFTFANECVSFFLFFCPFLYLSNTLHRYIYRWISLAEQPQLRNSLGWLRASVTAA